MDRRIWKHPILEIKRGREITFYFEGQPMKAYEGESIAVALYANGVDVFGWSVKLNRPRGAFCMIGKCSSCLMEVDGVPYVRTCIVPVKEGMHVKRHRGPAELPKTGYFESKPSEHKEVDVLVIGAGPAGLSAALAASKLGVKVLLVDENFKLGGQLIKQTHKFFGSRELFGGLRGFQIGEKLTKAVEEDPNVEVMKETTAFGVFRDGIVGLASSDKIVYVKPKCTIVCTGAAENYLAFENNDLPGIMGAGGVQTIMNVFGVKPGEKALTVGSGNVGLIISYQLLQAGVEVEAIVEALPFIGGWLVHAAKVRRYGVPILVSHTVKAAHGREKLEGATIVALDEKWREVPGTEQEVECDLMLLAVGLNPSSELLMQFGCDLKWIKELGGLTALRTKYQETTVPGVFVAGDVSGIEEATTAMLEGRIAGLSAAMKIKGPVKEAVEERERILAYLEEYRKSPVLERTREGIQKALIGGSHVGS